MTVQEPTPDYLLREPTLVDYKAYIKKMTAKLLSIC